MTSIRSFAEILRTLPDLSDDDARRFIGVIHEESQRLTRLLDEILDLGVLESGHAKLHTIPGPVRDAVDRAVASSEGLLRAAGVELAVDHRGMETRVVADFDRLTQVLVNLLSNAVKYGTSTHPRIALSARVEEDRIHLDVADEGPGIPPHQHERAFEKFARLDEMTLAGSAGLGLPISREIMRSLGGDLVLVPSAKGARFRATLPRAEAAHRAAE